MMREAKELAAYRVDRGEGGFRAIPMTEKEVENRCFFIRIRLRGKPAWKLSNEQIEKVRLYRMGNLWIIEDESLMSFVLGKETAPMQEGKATLPDNLAADGYSYCGSFAGEAEETKEILCFDRHKKERKSAGKNNKSARKK